MQIQTLSLRHGLVYGLNAIAHGEFIHHFLLHLIKVNLPRIISLSHWNLHHAASLYISREVECVLQRKMLSEQGNISSAQRSKYQPLDYILVIHRNIQHTKVTWDAFSCQLRNCPHLITLLIFFCAYITIQDMSVHVSRKKWQNWKGFKSKIRSASLIQKTDWFDFTSLNLVLKRLFN